MSEPTPDPEWVVLANDIRIVDGNHDLGAGALAEALIARGWSRTAPSLDVEVEPLREALAACLADFDRDPPVSFVTDWLPRIARAARSAPSLDVEALAEASVTAQDDERDPPLWTLMGEAGRNAARAFARRVAAEYARIKEQP